MSNITIKDYFNQKNVQSEFMEMLGEKRTKAFLNSVVHVATGNSILQKASFESIFMSAAAAASLDLSISPSIGHCYIVPYKGNAQFQLGYKGFIQLAQRSGQYKKINVIEVYENQFQSFNSLTEELTANFNIEGTGKIVGYCAFFSLINGFEKTVYWSKQKVENHGKKYSKSYGSNVSPWKTDFDAMGKKTVLKNALSKWGPLSLEMQKAQIYDQSVVRDYKNDVVEYPDRGTVDDGTVDDLNAVVMDDEIID